MKFGMRLALVPDEFLQVGPLSEHPEREGQQPHGRLLTAGEEVGRDQRRVLHLGSRAVRERRRGQAGQHVVARVLAAILDVLAEPLVEELERLVRDLLVHRRQPLAEEGVIGFGHALEVRNDGEGERLRIGADHLARALSRNPSMRRSANRHMKSSFSLRRFGVMSRISRWRCAVWFGGSNDGSWSLKGSSFRHFTMMSLTSSPSIGDENFTNDPHTTLHDENVPDGASFGGKDAGSP